MGIVALDYPRPVIKSRRSEQERSYRCRNNPSFRMRTEDHMSIIIGRPCGEATGVVTPSAIDSRLTSELRRVGWAVEEEAQFLRQVFRVAGTAQEAVDAVLD